MEDGLGNGCGNEATLQMASSVQHPDAIEIWRSHIIVCTKWLHLQPAHEKHFIYTPKCGFNDSRQYLYNEIHTGDWW
jgi:hypothetical protein